MGLGRALCRTQPFGLGLGALSCRRGGRGEAREAAGGRPDLDLCLGPASGSGGPLVAVTARSIRCDINRADVNPLPVN
jgi:hypothetical protein